MSQAVLGDAFDSSGNCNSRCEAEFPLRDIDLFAVKPLILLNTKFS